MTFHASNIDYSGAPALCICASRNGAYTYGLKRPVELVAVILSVPVVLPILLAIGLVISLDGYSPIFRQERVGIQGKLFRIWKFRTMVPDAENLLEQHLASSPEARKEWEAKQKLTHDPRCTTVGRFLRRTSLDELPQLLNVILGEMSLVGPRPMLPCQQEKYCGLAYYRLRPGMTGSWQVSDRNETTFAARASFDDAYERDLGFFSDVRILAKTLGVMLRGTGV